MATTRSAAVPPPAFVSSSAPVVNPPTTPTSAPVPPVTSSNPPVTTPVAPVTSSTPVEVSSEPPPPTTSEPPAPTTSEEPTSSEQPEPSVVIVTSTSQPPSSSSSVAPSSSSSRTSNTPLTITSTLDKGPSLVTGTSGKPSNTADAAKAGSSSSDLSSGAIAGIVVGVIAGLAILGALLFRWWRKNQRASRTAHRASMFEPWQTAPAMDEQLEKSYPMQEPAYPAEHYAQYEDPTAPNYAGPYQQQYPGYGAESGYPAGGQYAADYQPGQYMDPAAGGMAGAGAATAAAGGAAYYASQQPGHTSPEQQFRSVEGETSPIAGHESVSPSLGNAAIPAGAAGAAAGAAAGSTLPTPAAAGTTGALHDGMMVRVKVGFVRSLEDELAINQGQQLYLHTAYDDGWCLCENDAGDRGVVPLSCLEPAAA